MDRARIITSCFVFLSLCGLCFVLVLSPSAQQILLSAFRGNSGPPSTPLSLQPSHPPSLQPSPQPTLGFKFPNYSGYFSIRPIWSAAPATRNDSASIFKNHTTAASPTPSALERLQNGSVSYHQLFASLRYPHLRLGEDNVFWRILSTRWTSRSGGRIPSGLAVLCDWIIAYRRIWGNLFAHPSTIFLEGTLLPVFVDRILPALTAPFVLVTGESDRTQPRQLDTRYPSPLLSPRQWETLTSHPLLLRWFASELDTAHKNVSPLPVGVNPKDCAREIPDSHLWYFAGVPSVSLGLRKPIVLCAHRIYLRWEKQFRLRSQVSGLCEGPWKEFCVHKKNIPKEAFVDTLSSYSFLLCPHGGGIDPSKAFESVLAGTIPIIEDTPLAPAFEPLGVVVLPNISDPRALTADKLAEWRARLEPVYADRARQLNYLTTAYWWNRIIAYLPEGKRQVSRQALNGRKAWGKPSQPTARVTTSLQ